MTSRSTSPLTSPDNVSVLLAAPLADAGFELVDVVASSGTLQVLVDRAEGERIDLDGVARATRIVDEVLEHADPIPGSYTLEVSSPGLERPLRTPDHFRRFVGTTVAVKTSAAVDGERRIEGVLEAVDDDGIRVAGHAIAYELIDRARTVFVWGPQAKPGKGSKPGSRPKASAGIAATAAKKPHATSAPDAVPEGEQR